MKVLFGIPSKVHNEIAVAEVLAFRKMGADVETSDYGNNGEVNGLVKSMLLVFKNAINLKKKLRKQKSEIIYLNTAFDNKTLIRDSITVFILRIFNRPTKIVLKAHGSVESIVISNNILKNYLFNKISLLLVLSKEEQCNFLKAGINPGKVKITANAIDKAKYSPDNQFRKKFSLDTEIITLMFIGRFIEEKGILDLIGACKILKEKSIDFKLICLGDGPLFGQVNSLTKTLGLQNDILLLGHIPEKETIYYYSNCDILILPSYNEGFSMAIFQAVAAGKSIITTEVNAAADYFTEYANCLWVKRNSPADIYEKISILKKDNCLREKMNRNNISLADKFTADNIVNKLNEYFQEL